MEHLFHTVAMQWFALGAFFSFDVVLLIEPGRVLRLRVESVIVALSGQHPR